MSHKIVTKPDLGSSVAVDKNGRPLPITQEFQAFFDDLEEKLNSFLFGEAVILEDYAVADLPDATEHEAGMVYVADESGGAVPAFSDGVNWRRVTDRAIVT
jgi:hypothetical protein